MDAAGKSALQESLGLPLGVELAAFSECLLLVVLALRCLFR